MTRLGPNTWTISGRLIHCDVDALWVKLHEVVAESGRLFPNELNTIWWSVTTRDHTSSQRDDIAALDAIKDNVPVADGSIQIALQHAENTKNLRLALPAECRLEISIDRFRSAMSVSISTIGNQNSEAVWSIVSPAFRIVPMDLPEEHRYLEAFLEQFYGDHPDHQKNVFLIMRFRDEPPFPDIVKSIRESCEDAGLQLLRADDREYTNDLWDNVMTYMYGCASAIAVFDQINYREFNPNVAIEVGFMMASRKPTLLLKDIAIPAMPSDIVGKIYRPFNTYDPVKSISPQVRKWVSDYKL